VPGAPSAIDSDFYNRFLEIFRERMSDANVSVDALAAEMGLGRSQFYRKIKALTNFSPVELIRTIRLKEGRNMLLSTEKTVSEIAYATGFSTPAYFTKCYREAYGETPSETRSGLTD
jgi:transcriptional regulator GlxA family with amidase domain